MAGEFKSPGTSRVTTIVIILVVLLLVAGAIVISYFAFAASKARVPPNPTPSNCFGKVCGPGLDGASCGICPDNSTCVAGVCIQTSGLRLVSRYGARDILQNFHFYSGNDPTNGSVRYGNFPDLISTGGDKLRIDVSTDLVPTYDFRGNYIGLGRRSIRLESNAKYNSGLFVISLSHAPEGAGVWPAFWILGSGQWPCHGEIDIIEYANSDNEYASMRGVRNNVARHTGNPAGTSPCVLGALNCGASDQAPDSCNGCQATGAKIPCPNFGCGILTSQPAGSDLNAIGGGTFACLLTPDGNTTIWFWPAGSSSTPKFDAHVDVATFGPGVQFFPCPGHFADMYMVINTTLCGDWAGAAYNDGKKTGQAACRAAIADPRYKLEKAYWLIDSIWVYQ